MTLLPRTFLTVAMTIVVAPAPSAVMAASAGASGLPVDAGLNALAARLSLSPDPLAHQLGNVLDSPATRLALGRELARMWEQDRRTALERAAARVIGAEQHAAEATALPDADVTAYVTLYRYASSQPGSVDALRGAVDEMVERLTDEPPLNRRLRELLRRPGAAEAIYTQLVFPVLYPRAALTPLAAHFARRPEGCYAIPPHRRTAAQAGLDRRMNLIETSRLTAKSLADMAAELQSTDTLDRRLARALSDPLLASMSVRSSARARPGDTPQVLSATIAAQWRSILDEGGEHARIAPGVDRANLPSLLASYERTRSRMEVARARLTSFAERVCGNDELHAGWRRALVDDQSAVALLDGTATLEPVELLMAHTRLGSSLVRTRSGKWQVNPHRILDIELLVADLSRLLDDHAALEPHAARLGGLRSPLGSMALAAAAGALLDRQPPDILEEWLATRFEERAEGYMPREAAREEIDALLTKSRVLEQKLASSNAPMTVNLRGSRFSTERVSLFRSSAFYNARNQAGVSLYHTEFPGHHAARLFGVFDIPAGGSESLPSFLSRLQERNADLPEMFASHDKLVVYIWLTPRWLSVSSDTRIQGDGPAYTRHSPRDYVVWTTMVEAVVDLFKTLDGPEIYYEVWSEPDGYWNEGVDEFMRMYAATARAIKRRHPQAKVGGATMNAWDGTLRASRSKVPLNLELIRFATRDGVPLDFVSWHLYGRPPSELLTAKETYERELRSLGVKKLPEFVISEWSIGGRGTRHEATAFAETMLGLYRAGIDLQTGAPWQEFKPQPDPRFFSPWGMITQQGWKKPMFHTHRLFDRLARDSRGVDVLDSPDATRTVIVSRKADDIYELIYWDRLYERRLASAMETLQENGLTDSDLAHYGSIPGLEQAIETSSPKERRHRDAFVKARRVFEQAPQSVHTVQFDFEGIGAVEVLNSRNVGVRAVRRPAYGAGSRVVADRAPYEVMWLRVRASPAPLTSRASDASDTPTRSGAAPPG